MERLMMLYLLLSSTLLSITGCSTTKLTVAKSIPLAETLAAASRINTATYNTQINFFGKHLSGLMVFKATTDTSKRVIFMTETGFKFFDFEFTTNTFSVKYCLHGLDKKVVINTLKKDLSCLVTRRNDLPQAIYKTGNVFIYKYTNRGKNGYYSVDWNSRQLRNMAQGNDRHKSLEINFGGIVNNPFDTVQIADHAAHLNIFMKKLSE